MVAAPCRGTTTCCPSRSGIARFTAARSAWAVTPPASCTAASARVPAGTRYTPGRRTSPATSTTRSPRAARAVDAAGLAGVSFVWVALVSSDTGAPPESRWSRRNARKTRTKAATAYPASSALRLSTMPTKLRRRALHLSTRLHKSCNGSVTGGSNHAESAARPFRLLLDDLDVLHTRPRRTLAGESDQRLDGVPRTLEDGFDGAVVAVRHRAGDAARLGFVARRVAEEDALDVPAHDHPAPHGVAHA